MAPRPVGRRNGFFPTQFPTLAYLDDYEGLGLPEFVTVLLCNKGACTRLQPRHGSAPVVHRTWCNCHIVLVARGLRPGSLLEV